MAMSIAVTIANITPFVLNWAHINSSDGDARTARIDRLLLLLSLLGTHQDLKRNLGKLIA